MPQFETTHRVGHSAQEMFDLVADVEAYPQFVPLCERLVVRAQRQDGEKRFLVADMTIGVMELRIPLCRPLQRDTRQVENPQAMPLAASGNRRGHAQRSRAAQAVPAQLRRHAACSGI